MCSSTQIKPSDEGAAVTVVSCNGEGAYTKYGDPLNQDLHAYAHTYIVIF